MIEEGFLFRCVVGNVTITSLWVTRVAWVIPAYRWTGVCIWCSVGAWSLNSTLWHIMVTEFGEDGIITNTRVLRITIRILLCRYTRCHTLLLVIRLLLTLDLIHTRSIVKWKSLKPFVVLERTYL